MAKSNYPPFFFIAIRAFAINTFGMTPSTTKHETTITIPTELAERIRRLSDAQGKLRRQIVREAVELLETQLIVSQAEGDGQDKHAPEL